MNKKDVARLRDQLSFLGYEFLTWVFLFIENDRAQTKMAELTKDLVFNTKVSITLGQRLVTCLLNHKEQKTSIVTPLLEESHELFASLKNGHVIEALSLVISFEEIKVSLMLHATDFAFTQVKITNNFDNESLNEEEGLSEIDQAREEIFLRMKTLEEVEQVINALFDNFYRERMNHHSLKNYTKSMREQIEKRLDSYLQKKTETKFEYHITE